MDNDRLPLAITVGFTGHRVVGEAADAAEHLIGQALAVIGAAFVQLEATVGEAFDGAPRMRLLIGAAPGTDRLFAAQWEAAAAAARISVPAPRLPEPSIEAPEPELELEL